MDLNTGISSKHREKLAAELSRLLADSYTLYLKTHNFHWNVTGRMFQTLHSMFEVQYPESLSRWKIFFKWLLAIPHLIVVYSLGLASAIVTFIAFFAILFTKKYPEGLFRFNVGVYRWQHNLIAYVWLLRDEYPPFSLEPKRYPVVYDVVYP